MSPFGETVCVERPDTFKLQVSLRCGDSGFGWAEMPSRTCTWLVPAKALFFHDSNHPKAAALGEARHPAAAGGARNTVVNANRTLRWPAG